MLQKTINYRMLQISLVLFLLINSVNAQSTWRTFTSPTKSFSVNLPSNTQLQSGLKNFDTEEMDLFKVIFYPHAEFVNGYVVVTLSDGSDMSLVIIEYQKKNTWKNSNFDRHVLGWAEMVGRIKDKEEFTLKRDIQAGEFHGREFFFRK